MVKIVSKSHFQRFQNDLKHFWVVITSKLLRLLLHLFWSKIFSNVKYFKVFGMTNKNFQANHQNRLLNTKATSAWGSVIGPLKLAIRVVAPEIRLRWRSLSEQYLLTELLTLIDKMTSLVTGPLARVTMQRLWPLDYQHWSAVRLL